MGMAPGVPTEFWYFPGKDFCASFKQFTTTILATEDVPRVFSISYGFQKTNLEQVW